MVSSAANGIITSSKVQEAMTNTDRKHYCPHNPYQDSPQSIGKVAWCRRMVCWPMKNTLNCSCDMNKVGLLSWLERVGYTQSLVSACRWMKIFMKISRIFIHLQAGTRELCLL